MKTFFKRLSVPAGLRRKRVVVPALALAGALLLGGLWFLGHAGANSVWNQPSVPISDVLDRVDHGDILGATISGQRILLTDTAGRQSWTIEKESSMGTTEQYLRNHNVKVAIQSTDEVSFTSVLPNLLGLLVLLALLFIMLRRSNLLGNPMGAMTKHLAEAQVRTNEEREQTLNQLLVEMDGFNTDCAVVVIAATNRPDVLDPALLRSGRFDRRVAIDAPDLNGRRAILSLYAAQKPLADNINLDIVARQTPGFTGADLANLLNEAAILAGRNKKLAIGKQELEEAGLRVMAGPEKRSRMITPEEKAIIAYHEVGHALVMKSIAKSDPVHKVSVVSRGQALGITIQLPLKDRYLTSKSELIARMAAAMGGRAAEEIIFGDVTTGAKQDIEYATNVARQMVCEFGMSERLGLVTLHRKGDGDSMFFSELTAADVDAEVKALTDAAYRQAYETLETRRSTLVRIAEHLQIVETIDGEELDRLLLSEAALPVVSVPLPEIIESTVAPRIAAAEAHDWDEGSSASRRDSEPGPPITAS